jgi:hypothetical protein
MKQHQTACIGFIEYIRSKELNLEEGFFDSMKQGFKKNYSSAVSNDEIPADYESFASKAIPAIKKASEKSKEYSEKLGIPLTLATTIISAGIVGGPTVVPFAAMMYFVRKPVNKIAGAAFDKGIEKFQQRQQPQQQQPQQQTQPSRLILPGDGKAQQQTSRLILPGSDNWNGGKIPNRLEHWINFEDYKNMRDFQEGWLGDKIKSVGNFIGKGEDYWKNTGSDKVGGAIGSTAGYLSGKAVKSSTKIVNSIKSSINSLSQFASENKLELSKAAFLMSVGFILGSGIGAVGNMMNDAGDVSAQALNNLKLANVLEDQEISSIKQSVDPISWDSDQKPTGNDSHDQYDPNKLPGNDLPDYSKMPINKAIQAEDGTTQVKVPLRTSLGPKAEQIALRQADMIIHTQSGFQGVERMGSEMITNERGQKFMIFKFQASTAQDLQNINQAYQGMNSPIVKPY